MHREGVRSRPCHFLYPEFYSAQRGCLPKFGSLQRESRAPFEFSTKKRHLFFRSPFYPTILSWLFFILHGWMSRIWCFSTLNKDNIGLVRSMTLRTCRASRLGPGSSSPRKRSNSRNRQGKGAAASTHRLKECRVPPSLGGIEPAPGRAAACKRNSSLVCVDSSLGGRRTQIAETFLF